MQAGRHITCKPVHVPPSLRRDKLLIENKVLQESLMDAEAQCTRLSLQLKAAQAQLVRTAWFLFEQPAALLPPHVGAMTNSIDTSHCYVCVCGLAPQCCCTPMSSAGSIRHARVAPRKAAAAAQFR
jgi:hypothetical protein